MEEFVTATSYALIIQLKTPRLVFINWLSVATFHSFFPLMPALTLNSWSFRFWCSLTLVSLVEYSQQVRSSSGTSTRHVNPIRVPQPRLRTLPVGDEVCRGLLQLLTQTIAPHFIHLSPVFVMTLPLRVQDQCRERLASYRACPTGWGAYPLQMNANTRLLEELQYRDEDPPLSKSLALLEGELMRNKLAEEGWADVAAGPDADFWPEDMYKQYSTNQKCRIAVGCQTDESEFAQVRTVASCETLREGEAIVELREQTRTVMEEISNLRGSLVTVSNEFEHDKGAITSKVSGLSLGEHGRSGQ
eukprot:1195667-Prorocentrum_minimum.AAC.2